ncbi:MAG TPA: hypothetical protein VJQ44_14720 [Gemmatimonadales bacterium]|nr:hypothetical protein [Gemmatimonadales bacterium]
MSARLRALVAALLAFASITSGLTSVRARMVPEARSSCAGVGHAHETHSATPSLREGGGGCGGCDHGCTTPGHCVTSSPLAAAEAAQMTSFRRSAPPRYDSVTDPLRSTSTTPPIPPPQRVL